jgi:hypothetical protein
MAIAHPFVLNQLTRRRPGILHVLGGQLEQDLGCERVVAMFRYQTEQREASALS